ncbi:Flp family type IVb pilin [Rhodovulum sp. YNF3179]|uniref:Flp family type IVb pilin n=1 Tax=Rhodovulum sp. YNF3179 TaxID=3425127 RepID=UPI003D355E4D
MLIRFKNLLARFRRDEDGLALTEYVVLLGLLTAAVVVAVNLFGANLAGIWSDWASWISTLSTPAS